MIELPKMPAVIPPSFVQSIDHSLSDAIKSFACKYSGPSKLDAEGHEPHGGGTLNKSSSGEAGSFIRGSVWHGCTFCFGKITETTPATRGSNPVFTGIAMRAGLRFRPEYALSKSPGPRSIIAWHRTADDRDKVSEKCSRHAGETDRVQSVEPVQEAMNNVVGYADLAHRIDHRRQHVRQSHHGYVSLSTRFLVLRHAEAIAA